MNEEDLKALVGDKAFEAMTAEQRSAAIAKYTPPKKEEDEDEDEEKEKKKKAKKGKTDDEEDEDEEDLREKVRKQKEGKVAKETETRALEKAIGFNMGVDKFITDHADILPPEFTDLLATAKKETYDSQAEKASAIQSAFIQAFFAVQAHVDLLTTSQKAALDGYSKLTKSGKEQKARELYENLFEPALETLKKVKKAEELGKARSGFATSSKVEDGYKQKLIDGSRAMYLNKKKGA